MRINKMTSEELNNFVNKLEPKVTAMGGRKFIYRDEKGHKHTYSLNKILAGLKKSPHKDPSLKDNLITVALDANEQLKSKSFLKKTAHKVRHHLGRISNPVRSERKEHDLAVKNKLIHDHPAELKPSNPKPNKSELKEKKSDIKPKKAMRDFSKLVIKSRSSSRDKLIVKEFNSLVESSKCEGMLAFIALVKSGKLKLVNLEKLLDYPPYVDFVNTLKMYQFHENDDLVPTETDINGVLKDVLGIGFLSGDKELIISILDQGIELDALDDSFESRFVYYPPSKVSDIFDMCLTLPRSEKFIKLVCQSVKNSSHVLNLSQKSKLAELYPDLNFSWETDQIKNLINDKVDSHKILLEIIKISPLKQNFMILDFLHKNFPHSPLGALHGGKKNIFIPNSVDLFLNDFERVDSSFANDFVNYVLFEMEGGVSDELAARIVLKYNLNPFLIFSQEIKENLKNRYPAAHALINDQLEQIKILIKKPDVSNHDIFNALLVLSKNRPALYVRKVASLLYKKNAFQHISYDFLNTSSSKEFIDLILYVSLLEGDAQLIKKSLALNGSINRQTLNLLLSTSSENVSRVLDGLLQVPNPLILKNFIEVTVAKHKTPISDAQIITFRNNFPELYELYKNQHLFELKTKEFPEKNLTAKVYAYLSLEDLLSRTEAKAQSNEVWREVALQVGFTDEEIKGPKENFEEIDFKKFLLDYYENATRFYFVGTMTKENISHFKTTYDAQVTCRFAIELSTAMKLPIEPSVAALFDSARATASGFRIPKEELMDQNVIAKKWLETNRHSIHTYLEKNKVQIHQRLPLPMQIREFVPIPSNHQTAATPILVVPQIPKAK